MNEKGFTLLEMLLVLVIISVLLLLIIPNVVKQRETVNKKGCEAIVRSTESQVQAYQLDNGTLPSIQDLSSGKYISTTTCPDGRVLTVQLDGSVIAGNGTN
ncbi:competence type IV pilus major pilin ComGC [Ectobacillus sp. sgz5001026]|uniref:competence type IV pilus major pilin ComGC n=1 Tax=Ectobacillus sp. sgz5001026 TaxID=3242473 RepID=UPI0036D319B7